MYVENRLIFDGVVAESDGDLLSNEPPLYQQNNIDQYLW